MQKETLRTVHGIDTDDSPNVITSTSSTINLSSTTSKNNIENLFCLCGVESTSILSPSSTTVWSIEEEIGFYVSFVNRDEKVTLAPFWTDHESRLPMMSTVVRRINIIPASSVPCESTFSVAGYIRRKQRSSLSSTALRYSIVLKDSHKLELLKN